ncbi:MAG TPA: fumarate hydratase C-terminal domain-containing protein [Eoetvoesiella sp.]
MNEVKQLQLPLSIADVQKLNAGDVVSLSGEIVLCAGMATHERLSSYLQRNEPLPIDLAGGALMHLGSYNEEVNGRFEVRYINPTTSSRFNDFMPSIIRGHGLRVVGGKGGLDERSAAAMHETGCVYISFLGGACTLLSRAVQEVVTVEWGDFVPHYRLVKLRVENLGPAIVGIDAHGVSLYGQLADDAAARLPSIMSEMNASRGAP